ncbi:DUF4400 domain-containing protein [Endozoicomonas gorgoniicola]|uniref:DUF4400 domain-containing protein n=1 Tax=Endozoicomonas gorgoniicola TaxID=1234144 RepID=A0ABT3MWH6_9GAMM|nr:DUF4400 domain-containing protein [Endozoicomonas gorgoniicola]MCW7552845.1 DUF4400 domain-containing protein [Endozoicomonas gorgoniicola]MCW7553727.1 DUF4400 domain-containing protein [Endozoicomonas gorgoniicola]
MNKQQKTTSPLMIWFYGLVLILLWLAVSGQTMTQHLHREQKGYSTTLGKETGEWIVRYGSQLYRSMIIESGFQGFLMKHTTPDGQMGNGFVRVILFFKGVAKNLLILTLQLFERLVLLLVCLPFWGLILLAAVADGCLIRKIRYHDFHYTSPLQNVWSRRLCQWIPGLFLYLVIVPLPFPAWLIPTMALLTSVCVGWWTANWQKKV